MLQASSSYLLLTTIYDLRSSSSLRSISSSAPLYYLRLYSVPLYVKMTAPCCSCGFGRSNVKLVPCNHLAHARCLFPWPIARCPSCSAGVDSVQCVEVEVFVNNDKVVEAPSSLSRAFGILRRGRWSKEEQDYALVLMGTFNAGLLTIKERTKLGTFLCKMLQCSSARLSPKIKTGKKVFHSKRGVQGNDEVDASELLHYQGVQKKLSQLEEDFIKNISESYDADEANVLSYHIQYYWSREFIDSYGGSSSSGGCIGAHSSIIDLYVTRNGLNSGHFESILRSIDSSLSREKTKKKSDNIFKSVIVQELLAKVDMEHHDFTSFIVDTLTGELLYISPTIDAIASQRLGVEKLRVADDLKAIFGNADVLIAALSQRDPSFEEIKSIPVEIINLDCKNLLVAGHLTGSHKEEKEERGGGDQPTVYRRDLMLYVSLYDKLLASASAEEGDYCVCSMHVVLVGGISIASVKFDRTPISILEEVAIATKGSINSSSSYSGECDDGDTQSVGTGTGATATEVGDKRRRCNNLGTADVGDDENLRDAGDDEAAEDEESLASPRDGDTDLFDTTAVTASSSSYSSSTSYSASTLSIQDAIGPYIHDITAAADTVTAINAGTTGSVTTKRPRLERGSSSSSDSSSVFPPENVPTPVVPGGLLGVAGLLPEDDEGKSDELLLKNPIIDIIYSNNKGSGQPLQRLGTSSDIPTLLSAKTSIPKAARELNSKKHSFEEILQSLLRVVPFHVVEVWVPVQLQDSSSVLLYGGSAAKDKALLGWSAYSRNFFFKPEVGLPGRVSSQHSAETQPDVSALPMPTFLRTEMAGSLGIHAACGIPFLTGNNCDAVVVFYSKFTFQPTPQLIDFMGKLCESLNIRAQIRTLKQQLME